VTKLADGYFGINSSLQRLRIGAGERSTLNGNDNNLGERARIARDAFRAEVRSRYGSGAVSLRSVDRAKRLYTQTISYMLALHDQGYCFMIPAGCVQCGTFNSDSDITELKPVDLTP
jgi:hypothetical protein